MSWIINSIERLIQKNAFEPSSIFNYQSGGTMYIRANGEAGSDSLVGFAYGALKQAVYGTEAKDRLLLVRYESLTQNPKATLKAIYTFLNEPVFDHDFAHIAYDDRGFDAKVGTPWLHMVKPKIEPNNRKTLLPLDLFRRFENDAFWEQPDTLPQGVRVV